MKKIEKAAGFVINKEVADRILSMINDGPVLPSADWIGTWTVGEPQYTASDSDKPEIKDRVTLELTKGEKVLRLPLYMIASAMTVASVDDTAGIAYVPDSKVYRTSQMGALKDNAILLKNLMPEGELIIPKTLNIHGIEVRENQDGNIIVNSRYIQGYFPWANKKRLKGLDWPSILDYQGELGKTVDRDPDLVFEGHELTPMKGIDAAAPKLEKTAVRLYLADVAS